MTHLPVVEKLAANQHITVVLRLLVDGRGKLLHGELVGLDGKTWRRFIGWRGLSRTLHEWLSSRAR